MTGINDVSGVICAACGRLNPFEAGLCAQCGAMLADTSPHGRQAAWSHVPGPVNRESFIDSQSRHRRATWRLTAASAVAAIVTGIPMSIALTPVLYVLLVLFTWLVDLVAPVPQGVWDAYTWSGRVLIEIVEALDAPEATGGVSQIPFDMLAYAAMIWLVPGMIFMLICWFGLRALFRHSGPGGVLLSIGAREPLRGDFEERQLVNVIEEIAIAAGLPVPPRVMLLDSDVANAAVVGSSRDDATIVVSRALLDDLDRDATQGVLANLVASIGNGDLRGARSIIAIFETFGFAAILLKVPVSGPARRMLWRIIRYALGQHTPEQRASESRAVAGMLTQSFWDTGEEDDFSFLNEDGSVPVERRGLSVRLLLFLPFLAISMLVAMTLAGFPSLLVWLAIASLLVPAGLIVWYQRRYVLYMTRHALKTFRALMFLPYYLGAMLPQIALMLIIPFMLEPMLALLWRRRRYLADASAVQITRNPDGIARGLSGLVSRGGLIPGGNWASPMFVVGPEAMQARQLSNYREQQRLQIEELKRKHNLDGGVIGNVRATAAHFTTVAQEQHAAGENGAALFQDEENLFDEGSFSGSSGSIVSFHPPLNQRLKKLRRMGSTVGDVDLFGKRFSQANSAAGNALLFVVITPLIILAAVLMIVALVLLLALSLLFCGLLMLLVYGLVLLLAP